MHPSTHLWPAVLLSIAVLSGTAQAAKKPANAVLLSNVQSLTLRNGLQSSHRRVSALPQLKCVGGSGKGFYEVDVMRCENAGADYDESNVQWTCKAQLPPEFKLGSTDVICEGYESPDDPYILKGSCGAEYRLILTEQGEQKYGRKKSWGGSGQKVHKGTEGKEGNVMDKLVATFFWVLFVGVLLFMVYSFIKQWRSDTPTGRTPGTPPVHRAGGGGWGGGDDNDPPPPYDSQPPRKTQPFTSTPVPHNAQQGWRPGFWTGAAGGAAAGYMAGSRNNRRAQPPPERGSSWWGGRTGGYGGYDSGFGGWDRGEGSSGGWGGGGSSFTPPSTERQESTGFGSTRRR